MQNKVHLIAITTYGMWCVLPVMPAASTTCWTRTTCFRTTRASGESRHDCRLSVWVTPANPSSIVSWLGDGVLLAPKPKHLGRCSAPFVSSHNQVFPYFVLDFSGQRALVVIWNSSREKCSSCYPFHQTNRSLLLHCHRACRNFGCLARTNLMKAPGFSGLMTTERIEGRGIS